MSLAEESLFFGGVLTMGTYGIGLLLKRRFKLAIFNPILISMVLCICFLKICHISYDTYEQGAQYISYLLTPATIALAVPLYEQLSLLKEHWKAILLGIFSGSLASVLGVLALSILFGLDHEAYVSFLPKSITTAIGMGVSEELGGYVSLTVIIIILTGVLGNMFAKGFLRLIRVTHPIAKGIAIGTASHAVGTAKAMEMGEVEGAMSGLSICVAGVFTVVLALIFSGVY